MIFEAVLNRHPSSVRLNPDLPRRLEESSTRRWKKTGDLRYQHASDLRADLKRLKRDTDTDKAAGAQPQLLPPLL